ncbi:MAG: ribonuclease P protein component [Ilumatobacteraceae bacterium]
MIGRIHERRDFERLNRHGRRARTRSLWCRYVDDPDVVPGRVAFAIGRPVGSAVVRNRLRRRLRALSSSAPFEHGDLLIGAHQSASERSFDELRDELTVLLRDVGAVGLAGASS